MRRVTGLGGIFFKASDPKALQAWYAEHLGVLPDPDGYVSFKWRERDEPERTGYTVWSPFKPDTAYFAPSERPFMVNFRVADLHALLAALRTEGVTVVDGIEEGEFGKFGWILDPDGTKIELWEPPADQ